MTDRRSFLKALAALLVAPKLIDLTKIASSPPVVDFTQWNKIEFVKHAGSALPQILVNSLDYTSDPHVLREVASLCSIDMEAGEIVYGEGVYRVKIPYLDFNQDFRVWFSAKKAEDGRLYDDMAVESTIYHPGTGR